MSERIKWPEVEAIKTYREANCCGLVEARDTLSKEAIKLALEEATSPAEIAEVNKEIWLAVLAKRVKM